MTGAKQIRQGTMERAHRPKGEVCKRVDGIRRENEGRLRACPVEQQIHCSRRPAGGLLIHSNWLFNFSLELTTLALDTTTYLIFACTRSILVVHGS